MSILLGDVEGFSFIMDITFKLELFANKPPVKIMKIKGRRQVLGLNQKSSEKALLWLLESLVNINRMEIQMNKLPPLYKAGVRYVPERGTELWKDAANIFYDRCGDCEDLACWRVAELRNNGKRAQPYIRYRTAPNGSYIYHVMVSRADGVLEDPSKILGMKGVD